MDGDLKGYSDIMMHAFELNEDGKKESYIVFPITRYDNVLNAPHITKNPDDNKNSEFFLLELEREEVSAEKIYQTMGIRW